MNRREMMYRSSWLGLAGGLSFIALGSGCKRSAKAANTAVGQNAEPPSPLKAPEDGNVPVALVLGPYAEVLDFCGPLEVFAGAATRSGKPLFAPYMVAGTKAPVLVGGNMKVVPDHDFKTAPQPKVIVIPAMDVSSAPPEMFEWIRRASEATDLTMSVCNGAFVLAKTGLLDGKRAAAHHGGYFGFAAAYPKVHLQRGARFVEEGNLASAGGISSGIDLALRVVERYVGHETATQVADGMEYQGKGWLDPNSNEAYSHLPELTGSHPICPVCLSNADASISSSHNGQTLYFCSAGCKQMFDKHSEVYDRFLAEDATRGFRQSNH